MANNHQINFGIGFQVDKTGLNEIQKHFDIIYATAQKPSKELDAGLQKAAQTAQVVENALLKAFNANLGTLNVSKFNQELKKSNLTISDVRNDLSQAGRAGANAFNLLGTQILKTNVQLKQSNKLLDEMATSMANTVKWGVTSAVFNNISGSIQKAYDYTKRLNSSLNDIRIVTDKSAESMEKFAVQANEAAKGLGASTIDYTDAALIYYQQGLSDEEVAARAEVTLKAANVTGQTGAEVSEQLTAVWNGYKVTAEEAELYIDKLAAVAASTASDLEELSTGMSKVASAANSMGVDIDQLNAQLATIVSVTRQAPESVGTALKTIYARMSDLKLGGADEDGLSLGDVSGTMESMGISVLDETGNLREMGDVIEEVATKWNTWTDAQKTAMAQVMAGKRQYNNLVALFENWDMYTDALETSTNAIGTLQRQQDIYLQSTEAKMQQLKTTVQSIYSGLIDSDEINAGVDGLTNLAQVAANFINSFGGGLKSIAGLGVVVANIFNKQIANGINNALLNHQKMVENAEILRTKAEMLKETYAMTPMVQSTMTVEQQATGLSYAENYNKQVEYAQQIQTLQKSMSSEDYQRLTTMQAQVGELQQEITLIEQTAILEGQKLGITKQEILNYYEGKESIENRLDLIKEEIENVTKESQLIQENAALLKDSLKTGAATTEDIRERLSALGVSKKTQDEILNGIKNIETRNKVINKITDKIVQKAKGKNKEEQETLKILKQQEKVYSYISETSGKRTSFKIQQDNTEDELKGAIEQQAQSASILTNVTKISSALSTAAMSWMSVNSLMQTWSDENTSFGDKMLQTFMTAGMALPGLISSFTKLNEALGFSSTIMDVISTKHSLLTSSEVKELGIKGKITALKVQENIVDVASVKMSSLKNSSTESAVAILSQMNIEELKAIGLTEAHSVALQKATMQQNAFNTSMLANPVILGIVAALAVATVAIAGYAKHQEAVLEAAKKEVEESKEKVAQTQEEINKVKELTKSYEALNKQFENNEITQSEYQSQVYDLCTALGLQSEAIRVLAGDYEGLDEAMKKVEDKKNDELLAGLDTQKNKAAAAMKAGAAKGTGTGYDILKMVNPFIGLPSATSLDDVVKGFSTESEYFMQGLYDFGYGKISEDLENSIGEYMDFAVNGFSITANTDEERYKIYETIKQVLENNAEYANSSTYKQLSQFIKNMEEGALAYKESIDAAIVPQFEQKANQKETQILNVQSTEQLAKLKDELITSAKEIEGVDDEKAKQLVDDYLSSLTEIKDIYQDLNAIDYFVSIDPTASKEEIETILKDLTQEEKNWLYLRFDKTKSIESARESTEAVTKALQVDQAKNNYEMLGKIVTDFEESDKENQLNENQKQTVTENSQYFIDNFGSLDAFYELSYQEQKNAIIDLYAEESRLIAENKQQGIDAIKERIDSLNEYIELETEGIKKRKADNEKILADEEYKAEIEALQKEYQQSHYAGEKEMSFSELMEKKAEITNKYADKYGITYDWDINEDIQKLEQAQDEAVVLQEELNEIEDTDINITVNDAAISQTKNAVSQVISEAEKLQSVFESIGLDSIIDADEIAQIAELYPSLLIGAEKYADGTIKLNNDVVNNFTQGQMEQLTAETDRQLQSIDNQIKLKEATIKMLYSQLEVANQVAEGVITLDEGKGKSQEILGQFISDNSLESYNIADEAAFDTAQNQVDYWNSVTAAASQAGEAISAAAKGETINFKKINVVKGTTSTKKDLSKYQGHQLSAAESYNAILAEIEQEEKALGELYAARSSITSAYNKVTKAKSSKNEGSSAAAAEAEERNEELKDPSEEIDRYWELNTAIENINESLDDLQKKQDKLHGKQLIESLKKENELLDKQIEAYKALAEEQNKEAAELQAVLSTYGVVFDSEGEIANYLDASQKALDWYNQAVLDYNSFSIDEVALQAAEATYENFKSQLERYEELYYNEMVDTQNQLDDIRTQQLENNLETWEIALDLQLDLSEAERDWNDFLKDINEDFKAQYEDISAELANIFSNASTYTIDGGTIKSDIKALQDVMAEIDKLKINEPSDMFSSMSEAQEKLKELMETMQNDAAAFNDLYKSAWDTFISGIDQSSDKFDDLTEQFERIDDELTYQGELIELLYGEEAYSLLDNLYKAQEKNSLTQIDALKQQKDTWYSLWQNAEEGSEEQTKYYELWTKAQDSLNNKVTEYIELLKTDYMNTVDSILKNLEKGLTGGSIEDLSDEWEKMTEKSDKYLDSIEGLYEIQTLANKINDSITTTSSLKNQQKLQALYDKEIDYLREKENLTQYDLDAAEARYQIALKEIALEEAQNSKNTMKLTRGTDGNWAYQYVADEDVIASKQQELTDAYNELYQLSQDAYTSNLESLKDLQEKYLESYRNIMENELLSTQEKEEKILELRSYYLEQYGLLSEENTLYRNDLAIASSALLLDLYNQDQENFEAMTEAEKELVQGLVDQNLTNFMDLEFAVKNNYDEIGYKAQEVMSQTLDQWTSGAQQIADSWNADNGISVKDQILNAEELIWQALDNYQVKVNELALTVEQNFGEEGILGAIRNAEAATNDLADAVSNLVNETIEQLYGYRSALEDIESMWYSVKDSILEAINAAREYSNVEISQPQKPATQKTYSSANTSSLGPLPSGSGTKTGKAMANASKSATNAGLSTFSKEIEVSLYAAMNPKSRVASYRASAKDKNRPPEETKDKNYYRFVGVYITKEDRARIKKELGFDTGGYTGDWQGDEGRLALLHQKEIVLNATDTKNILDAVQTVRDMSTLSSSIEEMIMKNISSMIMKMSNLNSNTNYTTTENTNNSTENIYHISAEFPNANDVSSIKEALLSLPNIVSQRIAENKK